MEQRPVVAAKTKLFFEEHSRKKRAAPSPDMSSQASTPLGGDPFSGQPAASTAEAPSGATGSGGGLVVTTPHLENNPQAVESFLNSKVATARDVLRLVKGYHESIIRRSCMGPWYSWRPL